MRRFVVVLLASLVAAGSAGAGENLPTQWVEIVGPRDANGPRLVLTRADGSTRVVRCEAATTLISYLADKPWSHLPRISVNLDGANRGLVRFDVARVARFAKAELRLVVKPSRQPPGEAFGLGVFALTKAFDARTTWATQPPADEAPAATVSVDVAGKPDGVEVSADVTELVRAWASGKRANHGLRLAVAKPLGEPTVAHARDESLDRDLLAHFDFVPVNELVARARRERKLGLIVVRGAHSEDARSFNEMILYATAFSDPSIEPILERCFVLSRVAYPPRAYTGGARVPVDPLASFGAKIADVKPLALVVVDRVGAVKGTLTNLGTFDSGQLFRFFASVWGEDLDVAHDLPRDESRPYLEARDAWRSGRSDAARAAFERLVGAKVEPYALKARAWLAWPEAMDAYERLWGERTKAEVLGGTERAVPASELVALVGRASTWLLDHQRSDGSWSAANGRAQDLAITSLAAHALLAWRDELPKELRPRADAALARADAWLDRTIAEVHPKKANSFGAAYLVDYALARADGSADGSAEGKRRAQAAVELLLGGQLPNGAWAYDYSFGVGWTGGFGGWPKTDKGRAHSVNTGQALVALVEAKRAGYRVDADALARGAKALEAMKIAPNGWTYTWPVPINFEKPDSSIARAPLCEHARFLLGAGKASELRATLGVFLEHHEALRIPVKLNEGWGNPHLLSSYFFHYAYLHAARAAAELGDDAAREVLAAIRETLLGHAEIDDTWVDWEQMGKSYGTASALLALRLAR